MSLTIIKPAYPEADPRIITYAEQAAAGSVTVCKKVRRICEIFLTVKKRPGRSGSRRNLSGPPGITTAWS